MIDETFLEMGFEPVANTGYYRYNIIDDTYLTVDDTGKTWIETYIEDSVIPEKSIWVGTYTDEKLKELLFLMNQKMKN